MAIKTNLKELSPSSERFKLEITLPSGGYSNPKAFPGGKLTVYPWDLATSEWMSQANTSEDNVFLSQLTQRVTHLSKETVQTMVMSELPLVAMVSRALSLPGALVTYTARCPHCGTVQKTTSLRVPDQLEKVGVKSEGYNGDLVTLPESQDVLKVIPLTVLEVEEVRNRATEQRFGLSDADLALLAAIRSINDTHADTAKELVEYYRALSPADVEYLTLQLSDLAPGVSTAIKHLCDNERCKKPFTYRLTLAADFFRN
jgi:hypothetical protein